MAARVRFEPATLQMQGTELTTEPPHPQINIAKETIFIQIDKVTSKITHKRLQKIHTQTSFNRLTNYEIAGLAKPQHIMNAISK